MNDANNRVKSSLFLLAFVIVVGGPLAQADDRVEGIVPCEVLELMLYSPYYDLNWECVPLDPEDQQQ